MSDDAGNSPEVMRQRLIQKSVEDEGLRQRLLGDPKGTVERELGAKLPEGVEIRIIEETPETIYLVLPPKAAASQEGGELTDRDLEAVAGGWDIGTGDDTPTCQPPPRCIN